MSISHVLVVDDEADIRALIQEILTDEGYEVTVAADALDWLLRGFVERLECLSERPRRLLIRARSWGFQL